MAIYKELCPLISFIIENFSSFALEGLNFHRYSALSSASQLFSVLINTFFMHGRLLTLVFIFGAQNLVQNQLSSSLRVYHHQKILKEDSLRKMREFKCLYWGRKAIHCWTVFLLTLKNYSIQMLIWTYHARIGVKSHARAFLVFSLVNWLSVC